MTQAVISIVCAEFNKPITDAMVDAATSVLQEKLSCTIRVTRVPGAYELPLIVDVEAGKDEVMGLVILGYIERGETLHGEVMGHVVHRSLMDIQLKSRKPMGLGIIGPGATAQQAQVRHLDYAKAASLALVRLLDILKAP